MLYGVFQKAMINHQFSSLQIDLIRTGGMSHSRGGDNDEAAKENQVCA